MSLLCVIVASDKSRSHARHAKIDKTHASVGFGFGIHSLALAIATSKAGSTLESLFLDISWITVLASA